MAALNSRGRDRRSALDMIISYGPIELDCSVHESAGRLYSVRRGVAWCEHSGRNAGGGARQPGRGGRYGSGCEPRIIGAVAGRGRYHPGNLGFTSSVKRADLIRHLEKHGCEFLREGSNHTMYVNRNRLPPPRFPDQPDTITAQSAVSLFASAPPSGFSSSASMTILSGA